MSVRTITPYLAVQGASEAIAFYERAFGATERSRMVMDDGRIGHAEIAIDDNVLYLADEWPELKVLSPASLGGYSVSLVMQCPDVDAAFQRALDAGAREERPPADQDYGRAGWLADPFGHRWCLQSPPPAAR